MEKQAGWLAVVLAVSRGERPGMTRGFVFFRVSRRSRDFAWEGDRMEEFPPGNPVSLGNRTINQLHKASPRPYRANHDPLGPPNLWYRSGTVLASFWHLWHLWYHCIHQYLVQCLVICPVILNTIYKGSNTEQEHINPPLLAE